MLYTVVRNTERVEDCVRFDQEVYGKEVIQIEEEMGVTHQQHNPDRILIRTTCDRHRRWTTDFKEDLGTLIPTITQKLLWGKFGMVQPPNPNDEGSEEEADQGGG